GMLLQDLDNLLFGKPALTHRLSPGWRTEILTQNRGRFRGAGHGQQEQQANFQCECCPGIARSTQKVALPLLTGMGAKKSLVSSH
ncbi:MAG: hypothetical protein AB7U74_18610, partial [Afipia sp.]